MRIHPSLALVALSAAFLAFCAPAHSADSADNPYAQMNEEMLAPTVQLNRNCSGVVVYSDIPEGLTEARALTLVLTAKHCTNTIGQQLDVVVPVYDEHNRQTREILYNGVVVGMYSAHDLAMVRLLDEDDLLPNVARVAAEDVRLFEGEPVWGVGYGLGWARTITDGTFGQRELIAYPNPDKPSDYFRATPAIIGGNSGGPLFHKDAQGHYEIIGITSAGSTQTNHINLFVPIDAVDAFLESTLRLEADRMKRQ